MISDNDPFDPATLALNPSLAALTEMSPKAHRSQRRARTTTVFARIPYDSGMRLAGRTHNAMLAVLLELDHLVFVNRGRNPVELTNAAMRSIRISHQAKIRALRHLELAQMVTVLWRGRKSPLVTVLWHPIS